MTTFSDSQLALLEAESVRAKLLVHLDLPTPVGYCSGQDPYTLGGVVYRPRPLVIPDVSTQDPTRARWEIDIADPALALWDDFVDNPGDWEEITVTVYEIRSSRIDPAGSAETIYTIAWTFATSQVDPESRWLRLELRAALGLNPRAAGNEGNRDSYPLAPDPTIPITIAGGERYISVSSGYRSPPPPPGGEDDPPEPRWRRVDAYDRQPAITDDPGADPTPITPVSPNLGVI